MKIVKCCIPCCSSYHKTIYNGKIIQFFSIPADKKPNQNSNRRGKNTMYRNIKSEIREMQREAWLGACNCCTKKITLPAASKWNLYMCILHFYPSILVVHNTNKYKLKTDAVPTICLTNHSIENKEYKEINSLPRIVGSQQNIDFIDSYEAEMLSNHEKNTIHSENNNEVLCNFEIEL